jgi:hypothetical protein
MQAGIYMKMCKCSDFKYCLFGTINTAYRVFMRVYNGLLRTANLAFHQNITKKLLPYIKQIYLTYFRGKLLSSTKRVFRFPLQFHGKVSKRFTGTFYIKF